MEGKFNLTLFDTPELKDRDFEVAISNGLVDELLLGERVAAKCYGVSNRIFDRVAAYYFYWLFGSPAIDAILTIDYGKSALASICLLSTAADTIDYTEAWGGGGTPSNVYESVDAASAGKRFFNDQISPFTVQSDLESERIYTKHRWLYTPSQAVSSVIRSIGLHFSTEGASLAWRDRFRMGRVRLKDNLGSLVTLDKSASQSLLVEYSYTLLSA